MDKYKEVLMKDPDVRIPGLTVFMSRVHDAVSESVGFCDNIVLRDYLDFNISECMPAAIRLSRGFFHPAQLLETNAVIKFAEIYDYNKRVDEMFGGGDVDSTTPVAEDQSSTMKVISHKVLQESLLLGFDNMILDYGIIGPANWMMLVKNIPEEKIIDKMVDLLSRYHKKPELGKIFDLTEEYGPYPEWFVFQSYGTILKRLEQLHSISIDRKIGVSFDNNERWLFEHGVDVNADLQSK